MSDDHEHDYYIELRLVEFKHYDQRENYTGGHKGLVLNICKCGYEKAIDYGDYREIKSKWKPKLTEVEA